VKPSRVAIRAARFARSRLLIQHGGRDTPPSSKSLPLSKLGVE
jgi:hypothetical protein